ncbi:AsmA family protein [Nitrosovibrio sp. Nv4]|uniref:AsmA family protein n=1 Tax=Nitrosovibrio sp. Nv4 TaxID=1945880 RepID=UPI000BC6A84D|nr:AsmA family protein [Nitrosovibrio sp. Nv4]SOD40210.1 AsmA protein [Nitrosovibrio sp. Nv4]
MKRYSRYVPIIFVAVTILLLGFVIYIATIFDPNAYKSQIIQLVKDKKQRELRLDGDIKLTFFPSLGAEFNNLVLSEHKSDQEFAAAERVLVSLAILPLLRKQLELDEIIMTGLTVNLVRFTDGSTNIDDLIARDEEPKQFKFDIGHVRVEKSTLALRDEASGRHFVLADFNLEADRIGGQSGSIENEVRSKVDLGFRLDQPKQAGIKLATRLTFGLTLDAEKQYYAVEGLKLKSEGQIPGFNHLVINSTGDLFANMTGGPAAGEFAADKFTLTITGISGRNNLDIQLEAPRLSLTGENVAGKRITAVVNIVSAEANTNGQLILTDIEGTVNDFTSRELTAELESKRGDLVVKTMLASPLAGSITTRQLHLPDLKGVIHGNGPRIRDNGVGVTLLGSAVLDGLSQNVQASVSGKFADSNIEAKLAATGFAQPDLNFEVDIDQLDLDRFLSLEAQKHVEHAKVEMPKASEQGLDLSVLEDQKVQGSIRIGLLKAANSTSSGIRLDIRSN